jgi:hypothetical protein
VGLFDFFGGKGESRRAKAARARELAGDLARAVELFLEAALPDEAARVLLLRADAEPTPEKRIAFCASAAATATSRELRKRALGRKALLTFDVLKAQGGAFLRSEMLATAQDLEAAGELERAAEAYALAGDAEAEVRALTAAGAIERLEERLGANERAAREGRERANVLRRIGDLDRTAERRAALEVARAFLATHADEEVSDLARAIRARLARGPVVDLAIGGRASRYALGDAITVGRGDATITVASRAISRTHLRVARGEAGVFVEDLGTRNGTFLAGARIAGPIPVGQGLRVELGGEIRCVITPRPEGGVTIEVGGGAYVAPLGELSVGRFAVEHERIGDESYVVLRSEPGPPRPALGTYELAPRVELAVGDAIGEGRGGPVVLRVLGAGDASMDAMREGDAAR